MIHSNSTTCLYNSNDMLIDQDDMLIDQEIPILERTWSMDDINPKLDFMSDFFEKTIDQVYMLIDQENPIVERTWNMDDLNLKSDFMSDLYKSLVDQEKSVFERIQNMDSIGLKHNLMYEILKQMDLDSLLTLCLLNKFSHNLVSKFLSSEAKKAFPDLASVEGLVHPSVIEARKKRAHQIAEECGCNLVLFKQEKAFPTFEGTRQLEEYLNYRSTLVLWEVLSNYFEETGPDFSKLKSLTDYQNEANKFRDWIDTHVFGLSNISELVLSEKKLTFLPSEIGNFIQLQQLYLESNYLTSLPPEIGKLTNLLKLKIANNKLASLPSEIGNLILLQKLYLDVNNLTSLPPEIGTLFSLQMLLLRKNKLDSESLADITHKLPHCEIIPSVVIPKVPK